MNIDTLLVYLVVTFFYVTSPGPAVVLAIINGLRSNMKTVAISSFANILGLFILSSASILGLGVLLTTSATLFMIVKFIGAFYLVYLGIKFIKNKNVLNIDDINSNKKIKSNKSYFFESFFLAVTNPKPILFFTAIFPQFLDLSVSILPQFLIMTFAFLFISFFSLCSYAYLAKKSKSYLSDKNRMNWFHKITGGIFISMGIGLLSLKNHN
ncbi:LysE family translocator [Poseidonibacter lekithochrous]|uniref:LysE family translocator n=1 Tax=Poseidonibacter lekithochrous TaxID=1904463 RepID=UPI0008FC34BA|nr:LysE family translocator [Poseidonibacter lekithochrous]QKJ22880.1 transporter, LysE family [Poseidonibacter lekithochrous]